MQTKKIIFSRFYNYFIIYICKQIVSESGCGCPIDGKVFLTCSALHKILESWFYNIINIIQVPTQLPNYEDAPL